MKKKKSQICDPLCWCTALHAQSEVQHCLYLVTYPNQEALSQHLKTCLPLGWLQHRFKGQVVNDKREQRKQDSQRVCLKYHIYLSLKQIFCLEQQALQHSLQDEEWENGQKNLNPTIGSIYSKNNCTDQNLGDFIWATGAWKSKELYIGKQTLVVIPVPSTEVVGSPAPVATLGPQAATLCCIIHGGTWQRWAMVMKGKRKVVISRPQLADWKPKCDVIVIMANFLV